MMITPHKDIQHIYYGKKLNKDDIESLVPKRKLLLVNSLYMAGDVSYGIDDMSFEYSFAHRGDSRPSACILCDEDNEVFDFQFDTNFFLMFCVCIEAKELYSRIVFKN